MGLPEAMPPLQMEDRKLEWKGQLIARPASELPAALNG